MPFTLHPVTIDDASDITAIYQAAFAGDHIMQYFHPNVPASVQWEQDVKYYTDMITHGGVHGERLTKLVDKDTGWDSLIMLLRWALLYVVEIHISKRRGRKTVAFSAWQYPHTLTEEQKKEDEAKKNSTKSDPPEGSQNALIDEFFTKLFAGRKKWIVPEKTFCKFNFSRSKGRKSPDTVLGGFDPHKVLVTKG